MSSRVLSAYFDDFRKGKRQREELRLFLEEAIRKEPLRRGHFMGWLDQAQYEHPIPVTEFLLLRKEIEASLDNDDQTRIVPPQGPVKTSPDAETLVAGNDEETLVAPGQRGEDTTEVSCGSQPSDMARLHAAATMIAAPSESATPAAKPADEGDATVVSGTHASMAATRPRATSAAQPELPATPTKNESHPLPVWLWLSGALLIVAVGLGFWALRPVTNVITIHPEPSAAEAEVPVVEPETPEPAQPASEPNTNLTENTEPAPPVATEEPVVASNAAAPLAQDLSPQQALDLLQQRIDAGLFLPLEQTGNAQEVMDFMLAQYPESPDVLEARHRLKDAYLAASKRAQGRGEWDDSQNLLDAAFNVLSATAH